MKQKFIYLALLAIPTLLTSCRKSDSGPTESPPYYFGGDDIYNEGPVCAPATSFRTFSSRFNNHPIWPLKKDRWEESDELDYQHWIAKNGHPGILTGTGFLVDCADTAITLRWIYAHDKGLPAAQTLSSGELYGSWQSTAEWDALPTNADWKLDQRFRAALSFVLQSTYTHSLLGDLYPIKINRQYVNAGTIYLTLTDVTGHTRTLNNEDPNCAGFSCLSSVWGTLPESEILSEDSIFPFYLKEGRGGFLRFRWPEKIGGQWRLRNASEMPGYSREQFNFSEDLYSLEINSRLNYWSAAFQQLLSSVDSVRKDIKERIKVVEKGFYLCSLIPCSASSTEYETYSTPSRDSRLVAISNSVNGMLNSPSITPDMARDLKVVNQSKVILKTPLVYWDFFTGAPEKYLLSDPTLDAYSRWGQSQPAGLDGFVSRVQIFYHNWLWREKLVEQGQDTSRLDQAFLLEKKNLKLQLNQLESYDLYSVQFSLSGALTNLQTCSQTNSCGFCSVYDLLTTSALEDAISGTR